MSCVCGLCRIIISPPEDSPFRSEENVIAGNVILYGATSGEVYLKWMEEESADFLILVYVKGNNLQSGKIVLELKTNPEKYESHEFFFNEIFRFQDIIIDSTIAMLEKMRNKKETK